MYGKNYRKLGRSSIPSESKIVFISYRNRSPDPECAEACADIIQKTYGLDIWFDKKTRACQMEVPPLKLLTVLKKDWILRLHY